eukprot:CAMPEP_0202956530 /NCGR_PEP_ID=MMETSP1396-20130829/1034_1 /ASSEMBLY_ACC=CAM_ASM_000872 /TAXON_ID= /ORGANISM="Pseudokeronopsis sp., Strain Brazil" /LENGTH=49 /DNA_ID=CAMNT_0049673595 /DNA_START=315 /DNA_END=464 /DNA_ORIENTATION=-
MAQDNSEIANLHAKIETLSDELASARQQILELKQELEGLQHENHQLKAN